MYGVDCGSDCESRKNRREAVDENTDDRRGDCGIRIHTAERRVKRPTGIQAAGAERIQNEATTDEVNIPAQEIDLREGQILSANHEGNEEIPEDRGDRGN